MMKPVMSTEERIKIEILRDNAKKNDNEYVSSFVPHDEVINDDGNDEEDLEKIADHFNDKYKRFQFLLNQDDYNNQSNNYIQEYQDTEYKHFINHNTETDLLKRKELVDILSQIICENTFPKSNFNIGIYGEWGSGKSTFLNLLKKQLSSNKNFRIVEVDASEYEGENKIWYNILKCMFMEYENTCWFPKIRFEISRLKLVPKKKIIIKTVLLFVVVLCVFIAYFTNAFTSTDSLFNTSVGIIAIIIGVIQFIVPLISAVIKSTIPLSKSISKMVELPNFNSKLGDRESVKTHLKTLQNSLGNNRVILMVDELDRCSKEGVIDFFRAIQILNRIPNINIIFAVDKDYIITSLDSCIDIKADKYEGFLDKYIHFSVTLDNTFDKSKYVTLLLENSNLTNYEKYVLSEILQRPCCANLTPRKIKQMINHINLYKIIASTDKFISTTVVIFDRFIVWYIMSVLFPKETSDLYADTREKVLYENIKDIHFDEKSYKQLYIYNFIFELKDLVVKHLIEFECLKRTGESMMDVYAEM